MGLCSSMMINCNPIEIKEFSDYNTECSKSLTYITEIELLLQKERLKSINPYGGIKTYEYNKFVEIFNIPLNFVDDDDFNNLFHNYYVILIRIIIENKNLINSSLKLKILDYMTNMFKILQESKKKENSIYYHVKLLNTLQLYKEDEEEIKNNWEIIGKID